MTKRNKNSIYLISDHYDGKVFFNPGNLQVKKSFKEVLKMLIEKPKDNNWPIRVRNRAKPLLACELSSDETYITYINHATHLIQLKDLNILTDPIFAKRAGPALTGLGPKRVRDPGLPLQDLPQIQVVLVSHNHYDHMDLQSLSKLKKLFDPIFIVPLGNKKYLKKKKITQIIELDWWQKFEINSVNKQSVTLVPAIHWSMRSMNDAHKALWGGFWIESGVNSQMESGMVGAGFESLKIYFSGDTGFGAHFKEIKERLGAPDISILPIGSYEPRWFMKLQHMNPEEAVLASQALGSSMSIATHYQTFRLSHEGIDEPVIALKASMQKHGVKDNEFLAPETGETIIYNKERGRILKAYE